jgi:oligoendopeptidase F
MESTTLPERKDVPIEETWDLDSIFSTIADWQVALKSVSDRIPELTQFQGRLSEGPQTMLTCIILMTELMRQAAKVMSYGSLGAATDANNQDALARMGQGMGLMHKMASASSFIKPELMNIGIDTLRQWLKEEPALQVYAHFIDDLEHEQAHIRSQDVEEVIAQAGQATGASFQTFTSLTSSEIKFQPAIDSQGQEHEVGQSSIDGLITHPDREVRRTAWQSYADGYIAMRNTLANTQLGGLHKDLFNMRAHRYNSCLEASLYQHDIPNEVFYNLIDVFKKNLPTWHRYWQLRKKALKLDEFQVFDIKAPLNQEPPVIPFKQAVDWICEGMAPLGAEYVNTLRRGCLEERWVDRAVNKGKRQGAFSSGVYDTHPFVLISYQDNVFSLSTLAHELGHSLHSYTTNQQQPFIYSRYAMFVAEVASNFNQAMVRDHLLKTRTDPAFQLALIEEAMSNFHRYFFIMPTLARWELAMHEAVEKSAPLNARLMSRQCAALFKEGYGDEVVFDEERIGITWAQFQHMYMNFYVFQYATGISAAHALVNRILAGVENAVPDYLAFLGSGGSDYPINLLRKAGVDMTNPEPVEKAFAYMSSIVDRFEKLVA